MPDELKNIWKICFDDDEAYPDLYFSQYYRPENTLTHAADGKTVAMTTLLPATVITGFGNLKARYVYAVATLPDYRGQGFSRLLAAQADERMRAEGCALALVVPASERLFAYYAQQGFTVAFFRRVVSFPAADIPDTGDNKLNGIKLDDIKKYFALSESHFAGCGFFVRWDTTILTNVVQECRISGGDFFYFSNRNAE